MNSSDLTKTCFGLPQLAPRQALKHIPDNVALRRWDQLVHLSVIEINQNIPAGNPSEGDCYIVGP